MRNQALQDAIEHLDKATAALNKLILLTPSGALRNHITYLNINVMRAQAGVEVMKVNDVFKEKEVT